MQGSTRHSESDVRFLNSVIIVIVLALALVPKGYVTNATIISPSQSNVIATAAEQRNAMTCLTPEGTRDDSNNCIQVIQAKFNRPYQKPNQTFAVSVESTDVASERPILFVVRQQKTVTSWELPFEGRYRTFRRTLCPQSIISSPSVPVNHIVVDISTSSLKNVSFRFTVSVETEFNVEMDQERRMWLTPSENRYYQFAFPPTVTQVIVHSISPDDVCTTVSIQSPQCPVFDTIYNVDFEGVRQTMTGQSHMTVQKRQYPNGFYLVYIVNSDDQKCISRETPLRPLRTNRTKEIAFEIRKTISLNEFRNLIFFGTLGVYGAFIALVIVTCLLVEYKRRRSKRVRIMWDATVQTYQCEVPQSVPELESQTSVSTEATRLDLHDIKRIDSFHDSTTFEGADDEFIRSEGASPPTCRDASTQCKRWRKVSEMTKHQPDFYNKKSKRFISELCIIAVFYLIPVGQLVWNHKDMMASTGDQDLCYYNFACAYPYYFIRDFTDFNHFFSNIGYVVLGFIFLCITKRRDYIHQQRMRRRQNWSERGIPPHYGLSYSMGVGLIVEGILSAFYHVCPTRHNYQFDTSFMYVIAALCTLKLYHARHADVNVKSYMAYIFLALVVLLGAGTQLHGEFYFRVGFTVCHLAACVLLSIDIYYMGHCEWKLDKNRMIEHVSTCWKSRPLYLERLTLVVVGFVCNVVFAVAQLLLDTVDFNTHILAVFMINQFVYSIFYVVMKMKKREGFMTRRIWIYPFLYLLAALAFWLTGSYFFLKRAAAKWEGSPAESRMLNQECLIANIYDSHDIWHFLSSAALFFFFNFLLTLDDDIETKPRQDIPVF